MTTTYHTAALHAPCRLNGILCDTCISAFHSTKLLYVIALTIVSLTGCNFSEVKYKVDTYNYSDQWMDIDNVYIDDYKISVGALPPYIVAGYRSVKSSRLPKVIVLDIKLYHTESDWQKGINYTMRNCRIDISTEIQEQYSDQRANMCIIIKREAVEVHFLEDIYKYPGFKNPVNSQ